MAEAEVTMPVKAREDLGNAVFRVEQTARLMAFVANDADDDIEKLHLFDTIERHMAKDVAELRAAFEALYNRPRR